MTDALTAITDRAEAFWAHVDRADPTGCWPWTRAINGSGYGVVRAGPVVLNAHRAAWMLEHGRSIGDAMELDHLCRNRACVNPAHLDLRQHGGRRHLGLLRVLTFQHMSPNQHPPSTTESP